MRTNKTGVIGGIIMLGALALAVWIGIAWMVFEWRNPLCNEMAFYRHLPSVLLFKRLPQYQTRQAP